jgi:hypothetical protein
MADSSRVITVAPLGSIGWYRRNRGRGTSLEPMYRMYPLLIGAGYYLQYELSLSTKSEHL